MSVYHRFPSLRAYVCNAQTAESHSMRVSDLRAVARRRQFHDDITAVVMYFDGWGEESFTDTTGGEDDATIGGTQ